MAVSEDSHPDDLEARLRQGLRQLGLGTDITAPLLAYLALLVKWNRAYNLTAAASPAVLLHRHLLDSLSINALLQGECLLDAGSGAGLPGLPLAVANPGRHFLLVDSGGKKTRFLQQARRELGLDNVQVEKCRVQHYQCPPQLGMVLCRAFGPLPAALAVTHHLLRDGAKLLVMKGRHPQQEMDALPPDCRVQQVARLKVPGLQAPRCAVIIEIP